MCRIFGFRSVLQSRVHTSLMTAENALSSQSRRHPDGWGVAYYLSGLPHVVKSTDTAETDDLFKRVSGVVSSETVLAHVRKATQGKLSLLNTHPFQFGRWTFAHNGNIKNFASLKPTLSEMIPDCYKRWCLGETDSEFLFLFLMSRLAQKIDLKDERPDINLVMQTLMNAAQELTNIIGPLNVRDVGSPDENYLSFVLTNGQILVAMQGGLTLHWSTHKKSCPDRDSCPSLMPLCESSATPGEQVNHLLVSSEPLQGQNVWQKMGVGEMVGVDAQMRLQFLKTTLPTV